MADSYRCPQCSAVSASSTCPMCGFAMRVIHPERLADTSDRTARDLWLTLLESLHGIEDNTSLFLLVDIWTRLGGRINRVCRDLRGRPQLDDVDLTYLRKRLGELATEEEVEMR